jgi:hypothetical protein
MEQEYDIIHYLGQFDVVTKQIVLLETYCITNLII